MIASASLDGEHTSSLTASARVLQSLADDLAAVIIGVLLRMSTGAATLRKVAENEKKRRSRVTSQRRKQQQKREAASHSSANAGKTVDAQQA